VAKATNMCDLDYLGFTRRQTCNIYAHCEPECDGWDCQYNDHEEECAITLMEKSDSEYISAEQVRAVLTSALSLGFIKIIPDEWCEKEKFDPQI
jgi:hypothetical protein